MVSGHCGMILDHGGVVWVTLSDQEDSCDLFESCAVDSDQDCIGTLYQGGSPQASGAQYRACGEIRFEEVSLPKPLSHDLAWQAVFRPRSLPDGCP